WPLSNSRDPVSRRRSASRRRPRGGPRVCLAESASAAASRRTTAANPTVDTRLLELDNGSGWEEPPESLFTKELRRRGMTPTSLLEDGERRALGQGQREMEAKEDSGGGGGKERGSRNGVASVGLERGMTRPRERSMSVNSEGLEVGIRRHLFLSSAIQIALSVFCWHAFFLQCFVHMMQPSWQPHRLHSSIPYSLLEDEKLPHCL
ncbi:hypothetical protein GW17_00043491, partial [Ensete ventricosum]